MMAVHSTRALVRPEDSVQQTLRILARIARQIEEATDPDERFFWQFKLLQVLAGIAWVCTPGAGGSSRKEDGGGG